MIRRLSCVLAVLALALPRMLSAGIEYAQPAGSSKPTTYTVATLPASPATGDVAAVTDGATTANGCTVGGGSVILYCRYNGAAWSPFGDGNSGAAPDFSAITAGTNAAALVVGTGGSLAVSGSGTIAATTAAALAANPSDCSAGQYATTIAANGNLTCAQPAFSELSSTATLTQVPASQAVQVTIANEAGTGTTANQLAILTGAPSTAKNAATTDTSGIVGVVVSGAGTTGSATIARAGTASCAFDGATTAGDYVIVSTTSAGKCHDTGASTYPASAVQVLGRVLSTNGGAGTYAMTLHMGTQGSGGSGLTVGTTTINSGTTTRVLYDNAGALGEYSVSGSGNVAMTTSPALTTPTITTSQTTTRDAIGATSTDGIILQNTTSAAAGAQQYSPRTCWTGQGWKTNATAASQSVTFCLENRPVQGSAAPTGTYALMASINGGAYSDVATFTSGGQLTTASNVVGTQFFAGGTGGMYWTGRTKMASPADGVWSMSNNAASSLVQLRATGAPAVAGSCGTSPTVTGQDSALKIAVGTGSPTSCTVTFQGTWTTAPVCVANATATTTPLNVATTTTTVIVSSAALTASEVLHVACIGF